MKAKRSNPLLAGFFRRNVLTSTVVLSFGLASAVCAQTLYWDANGATAGSGNAGGTWDAGANWTADPLGEAATVAWADGQNAVFSTGNDGVGGWTVTIFGTVATPSILFEETGTKTITGGTITIGGGSISSIGLPLSGGDDIVINSILAGAGGLSIAAHGDATSDGGGGSGAELRLNGANTFSGGFTVTRGVVSFANSSAFGDAANTITLNGGGILMNSGTTTALPRNIIAGASGGTIRLYGGANVLNHSGSVTGSTSIRRTDGGVLNMNGDGSGFNGTWNNRGGDTSFSTTDWSQMTLDSRTGGRVLFTNAGTSTVNSVTTGRDLFVDNGGRLNIQSGTLNLVTGAGFFIQTSNTGSLTTSSGTLTVTNGDNTGTLQTATHDIRIPVVDFDGATPLSLVKNNDNNLTLFVANSYTGGTTINGGRVTAITPTSYGTGTVTVNNGGQAWLNSTGTFANNFVINGIGVTEGIGNLGAIRFQGGTISGSINVATAARIVAYGTTGIHTGALTGSGDLDLNLAASPGTLSFTGNTSGYTGNMTLNAGTLNLSGTVANLTIAGATTVNLNSGAQIGTPAFLAGTVRTLNVNSGATVAGNVITEFPNSNVIVNLAGSVTGDVFIDDDSILGLRGGSIDGNLSTGFDGSSNIAWNLSNPITVIGNLTTLGTQTVTLLNNPTPGSPATVLTYVGTFTGNIADFALADPSNYRTATFQDIGKVISVTTSSATRTWVGADITNPTFWDSATTNWAEGDNLFFNGDAVVFDDSATGTAVAMQGTVLPFSVAFANSTNDFTVTGPGLISGATGITKTGTGAVTLGGANTFTGAVSVTGGVLNLGSQQGIGQTSGVTVASGARVNLNGQTPGALGAAYRYTWTIAGDGGDGAGGVGAIANTGADVFGNSGILNLILSGNAEIGSDNGRVDVGFGGGSINGAGFTLTKVGSNTVVIRPATATNINYVVNAGTLTFEDSDAASGTNPIIVNGTARLSTFGARTIGNAATLNSGTTLGNEGGTGTWTGTLTAAGPITVNTGGGNIVIDGALAGSGNITRTGANTLFLQADASAYSGKINNSTGTLRIESNASLGTATGADVLTLGADVTLQGGTLAALASAAIGSPTQGITQSGNVTYNPGAGNTLTINGAITGTGNLVKTNNNGSLVFNQAVATSSGNFTSDGGITNFNNGVSLGWIDDTTGKLRVANGNAASLSGASAFRELEISTATVNIGTGAVVTYNQLEMSQGGGTQSVINQTAGTVNVTGTNNANTSNASFFMGHWGSGSASTYNLSGGTLNASGAVMSLGWDSANVNFNQSGGTANFLGINLANGRNNVAAYTMTGGRINLGATGITNASAKSINLGGGTVGAFTNWSSAKNINLTGTNGDVTIDTLDSVDGSTPRTITLTGVMEGSGGLVKEGEGSLVLNNPAGTFTGTAVVGEGSLFLNSGAATTATVRTSPGGTLRPGTPGAVGTATVATVDMDGGDTTFRVGTTTDLLSATTLDVSSASTISVIPSTALIAGQEFDLISYSGPITGLGSVGITLNPIANPHYSAALDFTEAGFVKLDIISADTITWTGATNGLWNVNTTSNWETDSNNLASNFYDFDVVSFDDSGTNTTITLVGTINPAAVAVNATQNYSFGGSGLIGEGTLTKAGSGALSLLGANAHTGGIELNAGTVNLANAGALGSGTFTINAGTIDNTSGGALTLAGSQAWNGDFTFTGSNPLNTGTGVVTITNAPQVNVPAGTLTVGGVIACNSPNSLTKTGSGTMVLAGGGSGNGVISVAAGTMDVPADTGERRFTVGAGATLNLAYTRNPAWGYNYGVIVNGNGVSDLAGLYFKGGTSHRFAAAGDGGLVIDTAPSTVRTYDAGTVSLLGGDINRTHLAVNAAASGSVLVSTITLESANFGYRMNIVAGASTATGDLTVNGGLTGTGTVDRAGFPVNFQKFGTGSLLVNAVATYANGMWLRDGAVILGGNNRLPTSTGIAFGDGAVSGKLVLNGFNQTFADIGSHNVNTGSSIVNGAAPQSTLTVNYGGAGRTFGGVIGGPGSNENNIAFVKIGAGVFTLAGANTYSGNTTVDGGTLSLADNAQLRFVIGANGVSNQVTGTGVVEFSGDFNLDLSGANLTDGNSWTLVDVSSLTESFTSTFSLVGFTETANIHTLVDSGNTWTFSEATGVLSLTLAAGFDSWAAANIADPTKRGRGDDADSDGFTNLQEFLFGTDPDVGNGALTTSEKSGNNLIIRWNELTSGATYTLLESATLTNPWDPSTAPITTDGAIVGDYQPVKATVPIGPGKDFFRVEAVEN